MFFYLIDITLFNIYKKEHIITLVNKMINILLCGGSGTRLWPLSRELMPKQFIRLFENKSLYQQTIERNKNLCSSSLIVSHREQFYLALDQCLPYGENFKFILEAQAKNTAPAILLACLTLPEEEIVLVTPSDHLIFDMENYSLSVQKAIEFAAQDYLVTFGIKPTEPKTGYGYIETENHYDVIMFHEKPDAATAQKYILQSNFYWNAGIFCFKVKTLKEEFQKYNQKLYKQIEEVLKQCEEKSENVLRTTEDSVKDLPAISIDYALFEKSKKIKVVPCDFGWNDLGSFDSLSEAYQKNSDGNTFLGNVISVNSNNNFVINNRHPQKIISVVDVHDLIIVDTADALLIAKKGASEKVKNVVAKVKEIGEQYKIHNKVHRPWGNYTVLEDHTGYKIKMIEVKPGKRLSLQKHFHRNEHWIVLSGTATVQINDNKTLVRPNESIYIKIGELHRLSNEGIIPIIMIEAQVGEYTGEDDIVRFDDDFIR